MNASQASQEFLKLWTANARRVSSYIYSMVPNWSDADDLLQETSVVLLEKFDEFEPGTSFAAWACKVAYFKVLEYYKRRRPVEPLDEAFWNSVHQDALSMVDQVDQRLGMLAECLDRVSSKDRQLLKLRYWNDTPVATVSQKTGRTVAAVYKAIERSHQMLLDCIRGKLAEAEKEQS